MTRNDIITIAAEHADPAIVGRVKLVLGQFKTVQEFLDAGDGALMKAYNAARPNGKRGVGKRFFKAMDAIRGAAASEKYLIPEETEVSEQRIAGVQPILCPPPSPVFYTVEQLRALVAFMDLGGVSAIDLDAMRRFCEAVKCNPFAPAKDAKETA